MNIVIECLFSDIKQGLKIGSERLELIEQLEQEFNKLDDNIMELRGFYFSVKSSLESAADYIKE